jgi:MarR family 2-MHQ and catechol resistance regulon transcriptional repressor
MKTSKAVQERIREKIIREYDLGITEFSVMEVLYYRDKQTIKQITDKILIASGSMTYVIDKLEQKGLVIHIPCPNDR